MADFKYQKGDYVHSIPWGCVIVKKRYRSEKSLYYKCIIRQGAVSAIPERLITGLAKDGEIRDFKATLPRE